jgi:tetratricopeptide (TPR) repeat protein
VDYIESQTDFKALLRAGGDIDLLKRLIAAGFPVIVEKGFQPGKEYWMGHYALVNGYDDTNSRFITQDSYIMADFPLPYEDLEGRWWRDFNYTYLVIYPPERETEVLGVLGPQADAAYNAQYALEKAIDETSRLSGRDLYFAWYNRGTNLVALQDYEAAALAYDQAFAIYPTIPEKDRPWRMLWYQIGPYPAYYYTGRFQDVINLADTTFQWIGDPVLEETFYWRGMAYSALGNQEKAVEDLKKAAELNSNSTPALSELRRLGVQP